VFGSNKLTTNIGASENVAAIFEQEIENTLCNSFNLGAAEYDLKQWEKGDHEIKIVASGSPIKVEAGYIGGGNAMLIFKKDQKIEAKRFIKAWSKSLIWKYPGIIISAALEDNVEIKNNDLDNQTIVNLFKKLTWEKSIAVQQTTLPRHGITSNCSLSGFSAEVKYKDLNTNEVKWISTVTKSKIDKYNNSKKYFDEDTEKLLKENSFCFSNDIEKLGQQEAQQHIAIVHIDGNSMGKAFRDCINLCQRRALSKTVNDATKTAWIETVDKLIDFLKHKQDFLNLKKIEIDKKKYTILPLRRIILNGDDITFVCNAQLAFWLTEIYLKTFSKAKLPSQLGDTKFSACAGIAITKTKFPFYRGYMLAEELCNSAKKKGRVNYESWIDFEILYGGLSGELEDMRKTKYSIGQTNLLWRPWRVVPHNGNDPYDFMYAKKIIQAKFRKERDGKPVWPRSKLKELAQILTYGERAGKDHTAILAARGLKVPDFLDLNGKLWDEKSRRTPYFDILQTMEFYPQSLLEVTI